MRREGRSGTETVASRACGERWWHHRAVWKRSCAMGRRRGDQPAFLSSCRLVTNWSRPCGASRFFLLPLPPPPSSLPQSTSSSQLKWCFSYLKSQFDLDRAGVGKADACGRGGREAGGSREMRRRVVVIAPDCPLSGEGKAGGGAPHPSRRLGDRQPSDLELAAHPSPLANGSVSAWSCPENHVLSSRVASPVLPRRALGARPSPSRSTTLASPRRATD